MKIQVWDSFNFSETNNLFKELKKENLDTGDVIGKKENFFSEKVFNDVNGQDTDTTPITETYEELSLSSEINDATFLKKSLSGMCKRGGFHGAVLADFDGLPISAFNSPVSDEILAVYSSILGESIEKAASMLDQPYANNISLDINTMDKIILRKFTPKKTSYFLLIVSPQNIDERAEIEITINQVSQILQ